MALAAAGFIAASPSTPKAAHRFAEDVTVSRIGLQRLRPSGELVASQVHSLPKQAKGMRMRYGPQPIERTLRQRQTLQPSSSEPALGASSSSISTPALPRLTSPAPAFGMGQARSALMSAPRVSAVAPVAPAVDQPVTDCELQKEAWLGILNGGRRVVIPFTAMPDALEGREHWLQKANDTDAFVRWYRSAQAEAVHHADHTEAADPKGSTAGQRFSTEMWEERRSEALVRMRRSDVTRGLAMRLQAKADLYGHLRDQAAPQGLGALVEALKFLVGGLEEAKRALDANRSGALTLMEFAGGMGVLGLDTAAVCGTDVASVFRELAAASFTPGRGPKAGAVSGVIRLEALGRCRSRGASRRPMPAVEADGDEASALHVAQAKWAAVARWMATAARRAAALSEERFSRGWRMAPPPPPAGAGGDSAVAAAPGGGGGAASCVAPSAAPGGALGAAPAVAGADASVAPITAAPDAAGAEAPPSAAAGAAAPEAASPPRPRQRCACSPSDALLETAVTMREQDQALRSLFNKAAGTTLAVAVDTASSEAGQDRLMTRAEFHAFFADLHLAEPTRYKKATAEVLDMRYDEALRIQADCTKIDSGLLFWSFKAALNNITGDIRLGWSAVVRCTVQVSAGSESP